MKLRLIIESMFFGLIAIAVFYVAMATALGGSLQLSAANESYALTRGFVFGMMIMILVGILQAKQTPKLILMSRIVGLIANALLFIGTYCYVTAMSLL